VFPVPELGGFGIYERGGQLVRPLLIRNKDSDNRATVTWRLITVDTSYLFEVFTRIIRFERYDRRSKDWVPTDCPMELPRMYEARRHYDAPPAILGIVHTPQLRSDGSLAVAEGYDPDSRLLFKFDGEVFPDIPEHPTRDDALEALELIEKAVNTFPFKTDVDRSVPLSLFLTVLCRRNFDLAPVHGISAPTSGTGKGLLVSLASILVCGQTAPCIRMGRNSEEFRKTFETSMMAAVPIIAIDNCERPLTGEVLCSAVTEEQNDVRRLGHSHNVLVQAGATITATGNNLAIGRDMSRRVLLCTIDAGVERPEKRKFEGESIKKMFRRRRGELVAALLTVLRAARLAQAEIARLQLAPLGGFEEWCEWVRDPLVWLGRADPIKSTEESYAHNIDNEEMRAVVYAWRNDIGQKAELRAQQVIDQADKKGVVGTHQFPLLREALLLVAAERGESDKLSAKRLGWWLRKVHGHPVDGLRLIKTRAPQGNPYWQLQSE
jgi:putative DNA primase/helicase